MFKRLLDKKKKGQNTAEYAILISLVVAAVIAMQTYVQRGLQAKMRDSVANYMFGQLNDPAGDGSVNGLGPSVQYEPYYLETNFAVQRDSFEQEIQLGNQTIGGIKIESEINVIRGALGFQNIEYETQFRTNADL